MERSLFPLSLACLLLFGLAMLSTASAVLGYYRTGDTYFYVKQQLFNGVIPGLLLFFCASRVPYRKLRTLAVPFIVFVVLLLALLFVPQLGVMRNGATRWLDLGFFSFQPSELLKLAAVLYLAALFASRKERTADTGEGFLPFLFIMGAVSLLLVLQPDLGTLGVVSLTALAVYFAAGARLIHLFAVVLLGVIVLFVMVFGLGYEYDRIQVYLNPATDMSGAGYQINKATAAIQAGGVAGLGFGQSQRKLGGYLPEPMGDSIFAIIAEELGFLGAAGAIALFAFVGWQGFRIAQGAPDLFGCLVAAGVTSWILIQAFINVAAISGVLPLTGVPLPFVSYGGTSLVVLLTACGIVYNIQKSSR